VKLIVGILCPDGVVMGADGGATLESLGQATALQRTKKLQTCHDSIIVGTSGSVGLGQLIFGEIEKQAAGDLLTKKPFEVMASLRRTLFNSHLGIELQAARIARGAIGHEAALASALVGSGNSGALIPEILAG
jgi:ATP-dependent protease HslVU (ClpYQ) peptidase subunit